MDNIINLHAVRQVAPITVNGTISRTGLCPEVHRLESTVRYLGIEVDDALQISEQVEL